MKFITATALCAFGVLASCGMSEKQCNNGDWIAIGQSDGEQGRGLDFISKHAKSCGKHGISVNQTQWAKGREEGLKTYCTIRNVYIQGRNGKNLKPVCPQGNLAALRSANDKGKKHYQIQSDIDRLANDRSRLRYEIGKLHGSTGTPQNAMRINRLRSEILQIDLRINHLRLQLKRYDRP